MSCKENYNLWIYIFNVLNDRLNIFFANSTEVHDKEKKIIIEIQIENELFTYFQPEVADWKLLN